ncbi:MAG: hypothetical protein ACLRPE_12660 [Blautia producta]
MGELVFETLKSIFGGTFIDKATELMTSLLEILKTVFSSQSVTNMLTIFISVSITVLTLYLFIEVANRATTEQLTFERLILILVKFFAAFIILANIKELIIILFDVSVAVYDMVQNAVADSLSDGNNYGGLQFFPGENATPDVFPESFTDELKDAFDEAKYGDGIMSYVNNMSPFFTCMLFKLFTMLTNIGCFLVVIGNAISLIVRTIFAPIGLVQLMEDGSKSAGIRYLKKFLADGLTLAAILGVLYAVSRLQGGLISATIPAEWNNTLSASEEVLDALLNLGTFGGGVGIMVLALQLAGIGAMFKASQIANDIVGV